MRVTAGVHSLVVYCIDLSDVFVACMTVAVEPLIFLFAFYGTGLQPYGV